MSGDESPSSSARPWKTPAEFRAAVRAGAWTAPTAGILPGYVQTNLVLLPAALADDFARFCELNPRPCPLIARTQPGNPEPADAAPGADLRTDVPRYRVFHQGVPDAEEPTDIRALWRDDLVGFLIGCSFTFERALHQAGLPPRHVEQNRNVPMYRTNRLCQPAGPFAGPLVVSMRPYLPEHAARVTRITGAYGTMHGAPIHAGDPTELGIKDLAQPHYGDPVDLRPGEVPIFWACGVTPQEAILAAKPELAITHSPGRMFVTDLEDGQFCDPA